MKKMILFSIVIILSLGLLTACTNRQMGTVGGAAVGGLAGGAITGSAAGAVVGAVGGGIIGNQLSR